MTPLMPPDHPRNSFAIPRRSRRYGTTEWVVGWTDDWPLVPWSMHGHEELFALVDDLEEQLRRFRDEGPRPGELRDTEAASGHLVVVSGAEGSGKTSLIHYCVNDLVTRLRDPRDPPVGAPDLWGWVPLPRYVKVVDVAGITNVDNSLIYRDGKLAGIEDINRNIYKKVLDILRQDTNPSFRTACDSSDYEDLHSSVLEDCYRALSHLLADLDWTVLVIVPNIKWMAEDLTCRFLRSCSSYSTKGIVFFLESTNSIMQKLVEDEFNHWDKRQVTHLSIGRLAMPDCAKFVLKRIEATCSYAEVNHVGIADDAVRGYRAAIDYRCVRDLQLIFHGVAEEARQDGVGVIDMARLREYQDRRNAQPDDITREPRTAGEQGPSQ